jgi:hypothetical protein
MNKARPALNENQPRVEQEMLWAGLLKVKRCNYRMRFGTSSFWNQPQDFLPYSAQTFEAGGKLASLHPRRGYLFDCDIKHLSCRGPGKSPPDAQHRLQSLSDLQAPGPSDPAGTRRSSRCPVIQQGTDRVPRGAHQQFPHLAWSSVSQHRNTISRRRRQPDSRTSQKFGRQQSRT